LIKRGGGGGQNLPTLKIIPAALQKERLNTMNLIQKFKNALCSEDNLKIQAQKFVFTIHAVL
jgi:hypothetical protein